MTVHLNQHAGDGFANDTRCWTCRKLGTVWEAPVAIHFNEQTFYIRICKTCLQAGIDEIDAAVLAAVGEKVE